jgi:hypothetical protein
VTEGISVGSIQNFNPSNKHNAGYRLSVTKFSRKVRFCANLTELQSENSAAEMLFLTGLAVG